MVSIDDIKRLIALDGGVDRCVSQYQKLGWRFYEPSREEIEEFNQRSSVDYCSKILIDAYAGATCFKLNSGLREERWIKADEFCLLYKFHLNESLDKIDSHDNQKVWRRLNIPNEAFDFLRTYVCHKIMIPQFLSTSNYKNSAYSSFFEIETCENSNGRYIAEIVDKLSEGEILFKSNTVFEINSCDSDTIYMTEVKSDEYDLVLYENYWKNEMPNSVYKKLHG
jgi:hypothetical protein